MIRELLVLRHAKSSWDSLAVSDFDRPLAKRGVRDATRLGQWIAHHDLQPDITICSSARRARETAELALADCPEVQIDYRESLYHAGLATLVNTIREQPDQVGRLMIVGHNPGMDQLLVYLAKEELSLTHNGKLMTTAAFARIEFNGNWPDLEPKHCRLAGLTRPGDLKEETS